MVKIFENNRKLIVTTILCIIYWCEVNAAADASANAGHNGSNAAQVQSRRGQRRRRTTTEDKSYHPRKRHTVSHVTVEKVSKVEQQPSTTQKPDTTKHEDRIEKWSLEEEVRSADTEDSTEHTNIQFYIMEHTTTTPLLDGGKNEVRRHRKDRKRKQNDRKSASDTALNWLLGAGQETKKNDKTTSQKPKQHDARKSRHRKDTPTSDMAFTRTEMEEKPDISDQASKKHHRKLKTTDKPTKTTALENDDSSKTTKKSRLREKSKGDKTHLRAAGYYDSEKEHRYPKHEYNPARMQYGMFDDRTMHRGLIGSSEEYEAKAKKSQTVKNKIKYLWNPDVHKEHSASKHKNKEFEKGHSDTKHHYFEDKKKHSNIKHKHDENVHDEQKHQYNENKKKHKSIKHPSFEDERKEEVHKYQNVHAEGEHTGSKHHSNRIHDDKTSNAQAADAKPEFGDEKKSHRHPEKYEKEEMTTHHEPKMHYDKIKDIRTGVMSHENPSSEAEDAKLSTKKVKIRNKSKFEPPEANMKNVNILRSTRIYGLQEDNAADGGQDSQEGQEESKEKEKGEDDTKHKPSPEVVIEDLNPYAIEAQMKHLAKAYNSKRLANVTVEVLGRTAEYNNIVLVKLAEFDRDASFRAHDDKFIDEKPEKKIIFIVHGLSVAGMRHILYDTYRFNQILKVYISFVKRFDIYVIPMANPDGYAATFNSKAGTYWNKNMSPQSGCPGVVLDRNFDVAWNGSMHISSCSPLYPGPVPFSEPETRAVRDVFHQYSHKLVAYIHLHASTYYSNVFKGDAILYPRGYSDAQTDDDKYIDIKGEVEEAMKNASFQVLSVTVDTLHSWYGKVYGTSVDYASTVYGIPYAMEFAMQLYDYLQDDAIKQIWGRLIPVVFKNIWKNINAHPDKKKK